MVVNNIVKISRERLFEFSIFLNESGIPDSKIDTLPWDDTLIGVKIIGGISQTKARNLQQNPDGVKFKLQVKKLTGQPT